MTSERKGDLDPRSDAEATTTKLVVLVREKAAETDEIGLGARKIVETTLSSPSDVPVKGVLRLVNTKEPPAPPSSGSTVRLRSDKRLVWELVLPLVPVDEFLHLRAVCSDLCGMLIELGPDSQEEGAGGPPNLWVRGYSMAGYRRHRNHDDFVSDLGARLRARARVQRAWTDLKNFMSPGFAWSLYPGCSEEGVQAMEDRFGLELPHELRESLMIHDGQNHADVDPSEQPFPRLYTLAEMMGFYTEKLSRSMLMLSAEEDPTLELVPVAEDRFYVNVRTGVVCRLPDPSGPTILSVDPSWSAYLTVQ